MLSIERTSVLSIVIVVFVSLAYYSSHHYAEAADPQATRTRNSLAPKLRQPNSNGPATTSQSVAASPSSNTNNQPKNTNNNNNNNNFTSSTSINGRLKATSELEDELPADFHELSAEQLDLGMNATGRAPIPILNVAIHQNGQPIDSSVTVHPGTPLEMVIYLDDKSTKVYGLLVSNLKVEDDTDRKREEIIIQNACSIDTYIFGNFELNPEDQSWRAKFRAFKFPDSNFVRFKGTVNVCIKQCSPVNCNGFRRKRAIIPQSNDNISISIISPVIKLANQ